ncbi:MAG: hypothetical protein HZA08_04260 [Nitrospirae bacterium]|nr:hypothetical protein [Nitrospirota bacterium]
MKTKFTFCFSLFFALSAYLMLSPAITNARDLTSIELIDNAYRSGRLTYRDALNYKVSAVIRQDSLPEEFKSRVPIKSATGIMMEARSNRHLLSSNNSAYLSGIRSNAVSALYNNREHKGILSRDLKDDGAPLYENITILQSIVSPARHFRIHYTTDNTNCDPNTSGSCDAVPSADNNNNNIPDYVDNFAIILDNVWKKEIEELGYDAPPSDGTEGGDCLLDVYLADLNAYGYTQLDANMPVSSVYLILENDFYGFSSSQINSMMVTAAHEFFHTIQFQITDNIDLYGWWMEASATWMEDEIYPDVNDYVNYLDRWFQNPGLPLYTYEYDVFQYGTSVWIKHLTEKYGSKFVYDVWNNIKNGDSAITGIEKVLSDSKNNSSLEEELKELRVANLTYTYDDGQIYKSSGSAGNPVAVLFNPDPPFYTFDPPQTLFENFSGTENIDGTLDPLSATYYKFTAPAGSGSLKIEFDGSSDISVMVVGFKSYDSVYDVTELLTDTSTNAGSISIKGFSSSGPYTEVVVIPLTADFNTSVVHYRSYLITASYTSASYNTSSILIRPGAASIVTENTGYGKKGKQQYYVIMKDNNNQILENGFVWSSDSPYAVINSNGFLAASDAVTSTITASLGNLIPTASLTASNPVTMNPGTERICDATNLSNSTSVISNKVSTNKSDKRCFIATAAFGSPLHPYVNILREFRDRYLLTNFPGRYFVSTYYYYSPYLAKTIEKNTTLKSIVKISLIPAIMFSSFMVKTTVAGKIASVGVLFILIVISFFLYSRLHGNDSRKI